VPDQSLVPTPLGALGRTGRYIFFMGGHLTNLPLLSRQCLDIGAGHFANLPCASRQVFAEAIPPPTPLSRTQATTEAMNLDNGRSSKTAIKP
jgi:hypothetical protein